MSTVLMVCAERPHADPHQPLPPPRPSPPRKCLPHSGHLSSRPGSVTPLQPQEPHSTRPSMGNTHIHTHTHTHRALPFGLGSWPSAATPSTLRRPVWPWLWPPCTLLYRTGPEATCLVPMVPAAPQRPRPRCGDPKATEVLFPLGNSDTLAGSLQNQGQSRPPEVDDSQECGYQKCRLLQDGGLHHCGLKEFPQDIWKLMRGPNPLVRRPRRPAPSAPPLSGEGPGLRSRCPESPGQPGLHVICPRGRGSL